MPQWLIPIIQSVLFAFSTLGLLRLNKALRGKRGALSVTLNLDDVVCVTVSSFVFCTTLFYLPFSVGVISALLMAGFGLLVFLDAMLFVQYRIEINRQTLFWFFTGSKGLQKGIPHLLQVLKKFPVAAIIPVAWIVSIVSIMGQFPLQWISAFALFVAIICFVFVSRNSIDNRVLLTATITACSLFLVTTYDTAILFISTFSLGLVITLLLLSIYRHQTKATTEFFSSPSLLKNILAFDHFSASSDVKLTSAHQNFVIPSALPPSPSNMFGACRNANVILITLESLGAYVKPYTQNGAISKLAEKYQHNSWISKQHFCLCPNTTVSTNQMYTGHYSNNPYNKADSLYPGAEPKHIKKLQQAGYKTMFLDSADIQLYDYHKLLNRIGFDRIWGTKDIPSKGLSADYRIWNMVDEVAKEAQGSPFFLHLINDQTHMPYEVVNNERFNRHKGNDTKSLYLNAVEEVDFIIDEFLKRLGNKIDLSNTMVVFTGDHGESFGEFGYSFHSNSIIMPQVQVPFMLNHPKLEPKEIAHSCHFDLFPTFFDLLGIECDYPTMGESLAHDDRHFAYFFHSATLKGNSPANFGFMLNGEMFWIDRLFNQVNILEQGETKKSLNLTEKEYVKSMLFQMLKTREILA